jgi:dihydroflavonol-4-reductase
MNVLLTGATGFIGSHVAEILLKKGYRVRCLVRDTSNLRWLSSLEVDLTYCGFDASESLHDAVSDADIVIHSAGVVAAKNRDGFFRGNLDATVNLLEAVAARNDRLTRFMHVSSLTVSGPGRNEHPITETMPPKPITTYGESKLAAEREVLARADKLPVTIVRPAAVYGPRDTATLSFFQSVSRGIVPLIGFTPKRVSLLHVYDLARGIVDAALSDATLGKTYNLGSEEAYTWQHIGAVAARVIGRKTLSIRIPEFIVMGIAGASGIASKFRNTPSILNYEKGKDITADNWTCSIEAAQRDFGFSQEISLEEGIRITVEWYRRHGWI